MAANQTTTRSNQSNKRNTTKKKTSNRGNQSNTRTPAKKKEPVKRVTEKDTEERIGVWEDPVAREVLLILCTCISVLLFLCNFGIIGPFGDVISSFLFGVFGLMAYVMPLCLAVLLFFRVSNFGNDIATIKEIAAIALLSMIGMVIEMINGASNHLDKYNFMELFVYSSQKHGGGILFGSVAYFLCHYLSKVGCGFLLATLMIICIVLITEKSILKTLKYGGKMAYKKAQTSAERVQERREKAVERREKKKEYLQEEEDARILRMNHKAQTFGANADEPKEEKTIRMFDLSYDTADSFEEQERIDVERIRDDIHEIMLNEEPIWEKDTAMYTEGTGYDNVKRNADETQDGFCYGQQESVVNEVQTGDESGYAEQELWKSGFYANRDEQREVSAYETYSENLNEIAYQDAYAEGLNETMDQQFYGENPDGASDGDPYEDPYEERLQEPEYQSFPEEDIQRYQQNEKDTGQKAVGEQTIHRERVKAKLPEKMDEKVTTETAKEIQKNQSAAPIKRYIFPPINLLQKNKTNQTGDSVAKLEETKRRLQQTLANFGVKVTITNISQGPTVTRYELQPEQGVKVSKIVGLTDDIKLNLAATDIRMEAPIPGKAAIGIEVPNKEVVPVGFRDLIESREFKEFPSKLAFAVGKDIAGKVIVADIAKMPHLLIAGATGSGKSVCINTIIMSLLYKANPEDVKMIMIDPKVVELSVYNGIPHLLIPVVTEPKKAAGALQWGVAEMTERYQKFADFNVRDLKGYNAKVEEMKRRGDENAPAKMPQIVIIVDELADLMMVAPGEVEESICRLAQLARAAGIHLVIATQRPSVDVITGLIKANMPSRVAFAVSSGVDSRTILDMVGAEKLLGKGDMLFYPQGYPKPARLQGAFISDEEVSNVVDFLKNQVIGNVYDESVTEKIQTLKSASSTSGGSSSSSGNGLDDYFVEAGRFIIDKDKASIGMLQRVFKIGFNRAARIMDQLSEAGVVGPEEGTKPRKILMTEEQFEDYVSEML